MCAVATNIGVLNAGLIAVGLAIGVASYADPLYIGEIAPRNMRGGLVPEPIGHHRGRLLAYIVDAVFAPTGTGGGCLAFWFIACLALGCGIAVLAYLRVIFRGFD